MMTAVRMLLVAVMLSLAGLASARIPVATHVASEAPVPAVPAGSASRSSVLLQVLPSGVQGLEVFIEDVVTHALEAAEPLHLAPIVVKADELNLNNVTVTKTGHNGIQVNETGSGFVLTIENFSLDLDLTVQWRLFKTSKYDNYVTTMTISGVNVVVGLDFATSPALSAKVTKLALVETKAFKLEIKIEKHPALSGLINLFKGTIFKDVGKQLSAQGIPMANKALSGVIAGLKFSAPLSLPFRPANSTTVSYPLTQLTFDPTSGISVGLGVTLSPTDEPGSCPSKPQPLSTPAPPKMARVAIADSVVNCAVYSYFHTGTDFLNLIPIMDSVFKANISAKLATFGAGHSNATLVMPQLSFGSKPGVINTTLPFSFALVMKNLTSMQPEYWATFWINVSLSLEPALQQDPASGALTVHGTARRLSLSMGVRRISDTLPPQYRASIEHTDFASFKGHIDDLIDKYVLPKVNAALGKGVALPALPKGVSISNTGFHITGGYLTLDTDFKLNATLLNLSDRAVGAMMTGRSARGGGMTSGIAAVLQRWMRAVPRVLMRGFTKGMFSTARRPSTQVGAGAGAGAASAGSDAAGGIKGLLHGDAAGTGSTGRGVVVARDGRRLRVHPSKRMEQDPQNEAGAGGDEHAGAAGPAVTVKDGERPAGLRLRLGNHGLSEVSTFVHGIWDHIHHMFFPLALPAQHFNLSNYVVGSAGNITVDANWNSLDLAGNGSFNVDFRNLSVHIKAQIAVQVPDAGVSLHGPVDLYLSNVYLQVAAGLGESNGRPTMQVTGLVLGPQFRVRVVPRDDPSSWEAYVVSNALTNYILNTYQKDVAKYLPEVNAFIAHKLAALSMKTVFGIDNKFGSHNSTVLDYALTQAPNLDGGIELDVEAAFYPNVPGGNDASCPINTVPFVLAGAKAYDLSFGISSASINCLFYSLFGYGEPANLLTFAGSLFNVNVLEQLKEFGMENTTVTLKTPRVAFNKGVQLDAGLVFSVSMQEAPDQPLRYWFTLEADLEVDLNLIITSRNSSTTTTPAGPVASGKVRKLAVKNIGLAPYRGHPAVGPSVPLKYQQELNNTDFAAAEAALNKLLLNNTGKINALLGKGVVLNEKLPKFLRLEDTVAAMDNEALILNTNMALNASNFQGINFSFADVFPIPVDQGAFHSWLSQVMLIFANARLPMPRSTNPNVRTDYGPASSRDPAAGSNASTWIVIGSATVIGVAASVAAVLYIRKRRSRHAAAAAAASTINSEPLLEGAVD